MGKCEKFPIQPETVLLQGSCDDDDYDDDEERLM